MSDGFKVEIEAFGALVVSPESQSLRRVFFAGTALKKKDYGAEPREVDRLAVVGSGFMGTGIAVVSARGGYRVVIKARILAKAFHEAQRHLGNHWTGGLILPGGSTRNRAGHALQSPGRSPPWITPICRGRAGSSEAVFEDLAINTLRAPRQLQPVTSPTNSLQASNTSAIPISLIAEASIRPENVIGMHYFSPVQEDAAARSDRHRKRRADWVLATAVSAGRRQGKTVIVVKDGPGFYTTWIPMPFMLEAIKLIEEGVVVEEVDAAIRGFGFPAGLSAPGTRVA